VAALKEVLNGTWTSRRSKDATEKLLNDEPGIQSAPVRRGRQGELAREPSAPQGNDDDIVDAEIVD